MSKYVWLIRHAESQGNSEGRIQGWADFPLTERGRWQAARLAERLAGSIGPRWGAGPIREIVTSPLQRAVETARPLAQALDVPLRYDARLREYNFGPLNGLTPPEIVARFPAIEAYWQRNQLWPPLPGEEGEPAFLARVREAMDEIVAGMDEGASAAVVAHGGTLDAGLRAWLGIDGQSGRRVFAFDNTSLSVVRVRQGSYRVFLLNDTAHLYSPGGEHGHPFEEGGEHDSG
jgi:broad specificity phosphatase PhoE